ncbi:MAG: zinc-ribbon domain containing protein [Planctomycetaceae bacterium]|nr:zinc-ribbon domain containing protein [Planctomycetaceae bacterium]
MKKRFHGSGRPAGAVAADCSKQAQNNSALLPPTYYVDKPFQCIDCGNEEVWTAEQQKWFYEVAKGDFRATAVRCRKCRNRIKDEKAVQREQMQRSKQ